MVVSGNPQLLLVNGSLWIPGSGERFLTCGSRAKGKGSVLDRKFLRKRRHRSAPHSGRTVRFDPFARHRGPCPPGGRRGGPQGHDAVPDGGPLPRVPHRGGPRPTGGRLRTGPPWIGWGGGVLRDSAFLANNSVCSNVALFFQETSSEICFATIPFPKVYGGSSPPSNSTLSGVRPPLPPKAPGSGALLSARDESPAAMRTATGTLIDGCLRPRAHLRRPPRAPTHSQVPSACPSL